MSRVPPTHCTPAGWGHLAGTSGRSSGRMVEIVHFYATVAALSPSPDFGSGKVSLAVMILRGLSVLHHLVECCLFILEVVPLLNLAPFC